MVERTRKKPHPSAIIGDAVVYAILLGVFLLLRIPFLSLFDLVEYDGTYYINQAASMLGRAPSSGAFPIGYPAAIALFLPLVRDGVRAAQIVSFLAGIGSVLILYALGKRLVSRFAAFLGALLFALTPLFARLTLTTLSESTFIFWVLLGFYLYERGKTVFFGLSMGMAAVTRPEGLGVFVVLLLLLKRPSRRHVLALAGFLPLFLANVAVLSTATGRFVLLPKTEFFGTTTPRWQTRETWLEFAGKDSLEQTLARKEGSNVVLDAVKRYPKELFLLGRHVMPVAAILALLGALRRRSFVLAGLSAFLFYPFFTPRSDPRYILPYVPFVLLYAAIGLDRLAKSKMRKAAAVLLVVSAVGGLFVNGEQLTKPVSDGYQWAKTAGRAWRERVHPGDKVADRKPFFAFYVGMKYVEIPIAPYENVMEYLTGEDVRFLMLHRSTVDVFRPALKPLLYDSPAIRGEVRFRQIDVKAGAYVLYERERDEDPLERKRITPPMKGVVVAPSWSPDGKMIAYRWIEPSGQGGVYVIPAEGGKASCAVRERGIIDALTWSPDSRRIAFAAPIEDGMDIHFYDIFAGKLESITSDAPVDFSPFWSRDGREIAFSSDRSGENEVWSMNLATGKLARLTTGGKNIFPALSPEGDRIAWVREGQGLLIMDRVTGRTQVTEVPVKAMFTPAWSPDGRFIAAAAEVSGGSRVYLVDARNGKALLLTKTVAGSGMPSWSPDGGRIVVVTNDDGDYGLWVFSGLGPYEERLLSPSRVETLVIER